MTDISLTDQLQPGETWQVSVERRLRELTAKTPSLGDLPLAQLQRKLENDWQPDGNILLQPGSVTFTQADLSILGITGQAAKRQAAVGIAAATWTAAVTSANVTITHGLAGVPVFVGLTSYNGLAMYEIVSKGATTFVVTGTFTDAVARSGTFNFDWFAIG